MKSAARKINLYQVTWRRTIQVVVREGLSKEMMSEIKLSEKSIGTDEAKHE